MHVLEFWLLILTLDRYLALKWLLGVLLVLRELGESGIVALLGRVGGADVAIAGAALRFHPAGAPAETTP